MQETNKALEDRLELSKFEINNLQHSLEAISAKRMTDPVTGLGNRKYFVEPWRRPWRGRLSKASRCHS